MGEWREELVELLVEEGGMGEWREGVCGGGGVSEWMDPRGSDMEGGGGRGLEGVCTWLHTVHQE